MLKFVKVVVNNSAIFLDTLFEQRAKSLDMYKLKIISNVESVEFEVDGKQQVYCIANDIDIDCFKYLIENLDSKITEVEDLSKDVLFDNDIKTDFVSKTGDSLEKDIKDLIMSFKLQATDCDVVLDKIIEKGIDSLTDFDKNYLK
jgi:hypothetical protein